MKRGFLLSARKTIKGTISQHAAGNSFPSPESVTPAYEGFLLLCSQLAMLTNEPAVLCLCRNQERKEAVQYFWTQEREKDDRFAKYLMDNLTSEDPKVRQLARNSAASRLLDVHDEAERRTLIKQLRKEAKECRKKLGWPRLGHNEPVSTMSTPTEASVALDEVLSTVATAFNIQ